jgi:DNA gyrase subunit A
MTDNTTVPPAAPRALKQISVEQEMRTSYLSYAMSVIVSRALPDVRDGLKPVHRRILYGMVSGDYKANSKHKKSARIVGDVMGKYHPHGDAAIYDAMVRMAQDFSMRVPLVDGQGNFGSIDGDPPAAMRYTEARMARVAHAITDDLDKDTVDFQPNYDDTDVEPRVMPARFPNLLVNGAGGIAVGMATNIPPHNLGEVIDGTLAMIDNPDIDVDGLMRLIPGPDFPTGGVIQGRGAIRESYLSGRASLTVSGVIDIEQDKRGRQSIVITELPYQVNKEKLVGHIGDLVRGVYSGEFTANKRGEKVPEDKIIEGVSDVRDESDANIRIVIDLKRDVEPSFVIARLKKHTALTTSFGVNSICLSPRGRPEMMGLRDILREFVAFREEVIRRRTIHLLNKTRDELNTQVGLFAARSQVDEVIKRIRQAANPDAARASLMEMGFPCQGELATLLQESDPDLTLPEVFHLSEAQARSVLELKLSRLTAMQLDSIVENARLLLAEIRGYVEILSNRDVLYGVMRQELAEVKEKFATPRRTRIEAAGPADISDDDLVEQKAVVLTLTRQGYVKITPLDSYREQARGGKGKTGMETKDEDYVTRTLVCNTRTQLIFFTSRGIAHTLKAYRLPETAANAKGRPIVNFLNLRQDETIAEVLALPEEKGELDGRYMMFVTDRGDVRRNQADDFLNINKTGKIAMKLEDENGNQVARLIAVLISSEGDDIVLATRKGKAVRFAIEDIRVFKGRDSMGNKGIELKSDDIVIGASIIRHFDASPQERDAYLSGGTAKWKDENEVEQTLTLPPERMAEMAAAEQHLLTITAGGYGKRFSSHDFRTTSRGAQGVWVGTFSANTGDLVACFPVDAADGLVLVTNGGQVIRTRASEIRMTGRSARGVIVFDAPDGQQIVDVARVSGDGDI